MKQFLSLYLISFLLGLNTPIGSAQAEVKLKVGAMHIPPFYIVDNEGHVSGYLANLLHKVLTKAKLPYELEGLPTARLYSNLGLGTTQVFIGAKGVPEYEDKVLYSKHPIEEIVVKAYSMDDKKILRSKADLVGKSLLLIHGYNYGGLRKTFLEDPKNKIKTEETVTHESALKLLETHRVMYLLDYSKVVDVILKKRKIHKLHSGTILKVPLHFIVSKSTPEAKTVMKKMEMAYEDLKK